ncbi:MAG TPA: response regulator [Gaiellaceae bacterium]|jgi:CheY-like chemotaxis protein|nr:response regulator [Gaiellaceae bacterium]
MRGDEDAITVLVADDAAIVRKLVAEMLADAGFLVVAEASDGNEAVALYAEHRPDVAILDVNMPGIDGIQAATEIKRAYPTAKLVIATVYVTEKKLQRMTKLGAVDVLQKPFDAAQLAETVARIASRGQAALEPAT